jgi:hypothetical protein
VVWCGASVTPHHPIPRSSVFLRLEMVVFLVVKPLGVA